MATIQEIMDQIFSDMPPQTRFGKQDAQCIAKHRGLLMEMEDAIAQGFYDVLYKHPQTHEILKNEDRSNREKVLRNWWVQTLNSEFDDQYWQWQIFVGLVHIKQKVTNSMMISMWGWLLSTLSNELRTKLPDEEHEALRNTFGRLATTIQSLTAGSVMVNHLQAITEATGLNTSLLDRLVTMQIDDMIKQSQVST